MWHGACSVITKGQRLTTRLKPWLLLRTAPPFLLWATLLTPWICPLRSLMGAWARMPLAVAPSMGVNAFFTYNVVGYLATKMVTYEEALAAAFVEGW